MKKIILFTISILLISQSAYATLSNICGFETGASTEAQATSGTFSVDSTTKRTGTYSLRINPTTTGTGEWRFGITEANGTLGDGNPAFATMWLRVYVNFATLPAANQEEFINFYQTTGGTRAASFRINSTGTIDGFDTVGQVGTGTTVLSTNTWYLLEFKVFRSTTVGVVELKINGTQEFTTSVANTSSNGIGRIGLGKSQNLNSQSVDIYYDDMAMSSSAYPGTGQCTVLVPTGNGTTMQWTGGTAPSDYTTVDEIPPDTADYVQSTATNDVALFAMQNCATVGITGTINAMKSVLVVRENVTGTSGVSARIVSGGTTNDKTAFNSTTSSQTLENFQATDPNTGVAWTTSGIDAVEVGAIETTATAQRMSTALVMVDYIPSAGGSSIKTINGLAKASVKTVNGLANSSIKTWDGLS